MFWKKLIAALLIAGCCLPFAACKKEEHDLVLVEGRMPTCTEPGVRIHYHCAECGKDFAFDNQDISLSSVEIPALGHDFSLPVANRPSCTDAGKAERTCGRCGYVEETELPAGSHIFRSYTTAPTCIKPGRIFRVCIVCGETQTEVIPETGKHEFQENNVCKLCNLRCIPSEGLLFEAIVDRGIQVGYRVSRGTATGEIIVPYYYDALPVLEVKAEGFAESEITAFISYAPLRSIGAGAFRGCKQLGEIHYQGSEADWENVAKGKDWLQDANETCKITFCE